MPRNIVICCDAIGNYFGERNSNVVKLFKMLIADESQVLYYHPGVGTLRTSGTFTAIHAWWTKVMGLMFGYGISDNLADAYQFLMRNFRPGDSLFVFGFSRGAYTARALCGMLHIIGLLNESNEALISFAIRMLKSKNFHFAIAADFKKTFSRSCQPHFVGMWDTIGTVGWIYNTIHFPGTKAGHNPELNIVRHALSIDERRVFFRPNLFGRPHSPQQDIKEVWFAGVHADVGGGYPESESQLSKITLEWMVTEAERAGLMLDPMRKSHILGSQRPYVAPDPATKNQHESLRGAWWIAELWPKIVVFEAASGLWKKSVRLNLGRRRLIQPEALVHESVEQRLRIGELLYRPNNLPTMRRVTGHTDDSLAISV